MPHTWYDLPEDIRSDIPRAPREGQENMLRQMSWTEEEIVELLGPPPSNTEENLEPDLEDHSPDDHQADQQQKKHFPKRLIAAIAGAVAFLAAVVDVVVNWDSFVLALRAWFPWLFR